MINYYHNISHWTSDVNYVPINVVIAKYNKIISAKNDKKNEQEENKNNKQNEQEENKNNKQNEQEENKNNLQIQNQEKPQALPSRRGRPPANNQIKEIILEENKQ